jgi:hypothetical protein
MTVTAPPLPPAVATQAGNYLRQGKWQEATDVIVKQPVKDRVIDPEKITHGKFQYDPTESDAGGTYPVGFRRNRMTRHLTAIPSPERLGKDAFQHGLPWLYSTILHEYQHVMQDDTVRGLPTIASRFPGQRVPFDILAQQEIEASATEISNARATHMDGNPRLMRVLWHQLHDQWMTLSPRDRRPVKEIYDQAYADVAAVPGIDPRTLHHLHLP